MNFDILYYNTLTPLILAYKGHAAAIFGAAFIIHCIQGSYIASVQGQTRKGFIWWKTAILSLLVYTLCYVPVPNPGKFIGFQDDQVDIGQTEFQKTTVLIFLIERLSYGFDELAMDIVSWDMTVRAQNQLAPSFTKTASGSRVTQRAPNSSEKAYNFVVLRGQFLQRLVKNLWNNEDLDKKGVVSEEEQDSALGSWNLLDSFSVDQWKDYLTKQISVFVYSLGALLITISAYVVILICSLIVLLLAGVIKYVPLFLTGVFLYMLPFAWLLNGRKAFLKILHTVIVYLPLKGVLILILWLAFFMVESIILQGYYDLAYDQPNLVSQLATIETGWIFTPSGALWMESQESMLQANMTSGNLGLVLISVIVALLSMIYVLLKAPSVTSGMLARTGMADDMFSGIRNLAATVFSGGTALAAKLFSPNGDTENSVQVGNGGQK